MFVISFIDTETRSLLCSARDVIAIYSLLMRTSVTHIRIISGLTGDEIDGETGLVKR